MRPETTNGPVPSIGAGPVVVTAARSASECARAVRRWRLRGAQPARSASPGRASRPVRVLQPAPREPTTEVRGCVCRVLDAVDPLLAVPVQEGQLVGRNVSLLDEWGSGRLRCHLPRRTATRNRRTFGGARSLHRAIAPDPIRRVPSSGWAPTRCVVGAPSCRSPLRRVRRGWRPCRSSRAGHWWCSWLVLPSVVRFTLRRAARARV